MASTKRQNESSIDRAISMLEMLASSNKGMLSVPEMAAENKIPRASAYRIAKNLESLGLLEYDPEVRSYKLGTKILEIASGFRKRNSLIQIADPHMAHLRNLTSETVSLHVPIGADRVCIHERSSPHFLKWSVPPGTREPLYPGASGKCILAYMHPDRLSAILDDGILETERVKGPIDLNNFIDELEATRNSGYCLSIEEVHEGAVAIAAPLLNRDGYSIGCITLSLPTTRWSDEKLEILYPEVIKCAESISEKD